MAHQPFLLRASTARPRSVCMLVSSSSSIHPSNCLLPLLYPPRQRETCREHVISGPWACLYVSSIQGNIIGDEIAAPGVASKTTPRGSRRASTISSWTPAATPAAKFSQQGSLQMVHQTFSFLGPMCGSQLLSSGQTRQQRQHSFPALL